MNNTLILMAVAVLVVLGAVLFAGALQKIDRPPRSNRPEELTREQRIAAMVARQESLAKLMREDGKSLLRPMVDGRPRGHGKTYRPVLTKALPTPEAKPPKAAKVTAIWRAK